MSRHRRQASQALPTTFDFAQDEATKGKGIGTSTGVYGNVAGAKAEGGDAKDKVAAGAAVARPPPAAPEAKKKQCAGGS